MLKKMATCSNFVLVMMLSLHSSANGQSITDTPPDISTILLEEIRDMANVPGMAAAYWHNGEVIWTGEAGQRDVETNAAVEPGTRFRLASVSKLVAASAAWRLYERGLLDIDAPISRYVEGLRPEWQAITVRQLAAHASGMPHYQEVDSERGSRAFTSAQEALSLFRNRDLLSAPGSTYSYSSWGYVLLSAVIEEVTGENFADHIERNFVPGQGITRDMGDSSNVHYSRTYQFEGGTPTRAPAYDTSFTWAGGGLSASATDLVQFAGNLMSGNLVSPPGWRAMRQVFRLSDGTAAGERDYQVGFGWRSGRDADGATIAHHAGIVIGGRSVLVTWPEERAAVALLGNAEWISSIETTAMMLAAPMRPRPAGLTSIACPVRATWANGRFGEEEVRLAVRFSIVDGRCRGTIDVAQTPLARFFDRGMQPTSAQLRVVNLAADGALSRAAFVTPFGLYDMRVQPDSSIEAMVASRRLALRIGPLE